MRIPVPLTGACLCLFAASLLLSAAWSQAPSAPVRDAERTFQRHVSSWKELREKNVVMQSRDYSCGAAALATLIKYYWGDNVTEMTFLLALDKILTRAETRDRIQNGLTLTDLRKAAERQGYQAALGKLEFDKLTESKVPLLVGLTVGEFKHFVVYRGTDGELVYLADPIRGNIRIPASDFRQQWQENAVLAVAKPNEKVKTTSPLAVRLEEILLGESNKDMIQKTYLKAPVPFPTLYTR